MPSHLETLAAIVDTFAPGEPPGVDPAVPGGLPSASALGIHERLLAEVEALGRPDLVLQLRLLLRAVENPILNLGLVGRPVRFSRLPLAEREAFLRRLGTSPVPLTRTGFQDLKRLTLILLYGIESSPYRALTGVTAPAPDVPDASGLDVRTPRPGEIVEADACVIGSGAGGGVAAAVLAASGKRVVVLERAANVTERDFGGPELAGLEKLFLDRGLAATSDRWLSIRAGNAVGGGTVVNWSSSLRLPDAIREEWRAAGVDDLDRHYDAVEARLGVTSGESARNGPNAALERGLAALGLPSVTIPRNVRGCTDCGPCAVGCRSGAKQSVLRTYLADACAAGASILDRTEARRILVRDGRVEGVVASVPGGEITVRAPLVALAGGSILSPAVLLRSGIATGTAGRSLLLHPVTAVLGHYDDAIHPWSGVPQSVMSDAFAEVDGTHGFRIEAAPMHPGIIASGYPWWSDAQHRAGLADASRCAAFLGIVKDRTPGRIGVGRDGSVRIQYGVGDPERRLLLRATVELARIHHAAGARRIVTLHTLPLSFGRGASIDAFAAAIERRGIVPNRILLFTAHQLASCRIGTSAKDSTADPDGKVRGVDGLYVTDASAFPTASGVNPMLSVMALARRTAERMAAR